MLKLSPSLLNSLNSPEAFKNRVRYWADENQRFWQLNFKRCNFACMQANLSHFSLAVALLP